ncbi:MAG: hypothetical protein ACRYG8_51275 [Janthinobacterium lividum]
MQVVEDAHRPAATSRASSEPAVTRRNGTIPVTVRLDPPRYDRLKRVVAQLSTTGQSIIQTALDRSLTVLERQRTDQPAVTGQSSLFGSAPVADMPRRPRQDSFAFVRPEPTVALTYRASVPMHRWLHRRSHETGQTIQDIIDSALKAARGDS